MKFRNLRAELARQGKTQKDLAEHLNVLQGTVSRWLSGKTEPRISECKAISEWLGVSVDELFAD